VTADVSRIAARLGAATIVAAALSLPVPTVAANAPGQAGQASVKADARAHQAKERPLARVNKGKWAAVETEEPAQSISGDPGRVAAWIVASHDNGSLPYIIIDKRTAELFLFDASGRLLGQTPVLIGIGVGDDSSPGIGTKKSLAEIGPAERTTPAGRFVARYGKAFGHERVLWVDYATSVALHAVITSNKKERRVERLLTPTSDDNRISFGCINVGTTFYNRQVRPLFQKAGGVVYILPDSKALDDVFPNLRVLPYLQASAPKVPSAE
jgi:hypothetical protein